MSTFSPSAQAAITEMEKKRDGRPAAQPGGAQPERKPKGKGKSQGKRRR